MFWNGCAKNHQGSVGKGRDDNGGDNGMQHESKIFSSANICAEWAGHSLVFYCVNVTGIQLSTTEFVRVTRLSVGWYRHAHQSYHYAKLLNAAYFNLT